MKLAPLKFKTYTWPHNPESYAIVFEKDLVAHKYPDMRGAEIEDLDTQNRIITGKGSFSGEGAYEEFKNLAAVFYDKGPGALIHPIWQITSAQFKRLQLIQEPRPNYVEYEFEFWEDTPAIVENNNLVDTQSETLNRIIENKLHIVKQGEFLISIAKKYDVSLDNLLAVNPAIKNPNKINIGQKITIPVNA